jgi:plastocyanin
MAGFVTVACSGPGTSGGDLVDDDAAVAEADGAGSTADDASTADSPQGGTEPEPLPDLPDVACVSDAECVPEDGTMPNCKVAQCVDGECVFGTAEDGASCDDGSSCTQGDVCAAGECVAEAMLCDDDNPCTTDGCDPLGGCVHTFHQKPCDDGQECTVSDHCYLGECLGDSIDCEDGNPCTIDVCDEVAGCLSENSVEPCNDFDACTTGDVCTGGECAPGAPVDCGASTSCLTATCDTNIGCVQTYIDGACEDSNMCTENDICMDGLCVGTVVTCDDSNICTSDKCVPMSGCQNSNNNNPCDDGDSCTLNDACNGGSCSPGSPDVLCCDDDSTCDDGDPCTLDSCDNAYCAFNPLVCDDASDCTGDTCVDGDCVFSPYGAFASGALFSNGFEANSDLLEWEVATISTETTWQLDTSKANTGSTSLYCGKIPDYTYDFGEVDASITRTVALPPGAAALSFWLMQNVQESSCSYDVVTIEVDGVALEPKICTTVVSWTQYTYDLSGWSGMSVELGVRFATGDGYANAGEGVWLDDIELQAATPDNCCLYDDDCAGGVGCLAEVCTEPLYKCAIATSEIACDDDNPCTADACSDDGSCAFEDIPGCVPPCTPACEGLACGQDGCGGVCGECDDGESCVEGACAVDCVPLAECGDVACGELDDGCDGTLACGTCGEGSTCTEGACVEDCVPLAECGDVACGELDDGCDGTLACGSCGAGQTCTDGECVGGCTPATECATDACGTTSDGCTGSLECGDCGDGEACTDGTCVAECIPETVCGADTCGDLDDGCGGTLACGTCDPGSTCTNGACVVDCIPETVCGADTCGDLDDGCGGTLACGTCGAGETCNAGVCEADAPAPECSPTYADCTEPDFDAGDMTGSAATIAIDMVNQAPYSPKCLRVHVGQTVTIEATGSHPFKKVCAEDDVMDLGDGSTNTVEFTLMTPGYYNYRCEFHGSMVGNIEVVEP